MLKSKRNSLFSPNIASIAIALGIVESLPHLSVIFSSKEQLYLSILSTSIASFAAVTYLSATLPALLRAALNFWKSGLQEKFS